MSTPPSRGRTLQMRAVKIGNGVLAAGLLALLAALLHNHFQIITTAVPLDYFEGSMPLITGLIANGSNPYTFQWQPAYSDVYPPFYNLIVAPLSLLFGNTLQLHRLVAGIFILLSCALVWLACRRAAATRLNSLAAASLCYGALLFYATPVASTNSTGTLLFLASVLAPWACGFSTRSLAFALFCGLLAFYSKQYFGFGLALVAGYLFVAVSKARGLGFAALVGACTAASLVAVHLSSPYFLDNTVFSVGNSASMLRSVEVLKRQLTFFGWSYLGLAPLLLAVAALSLYRIDRTHPHLPWLDLGTLNAPLILRPLNYFWFCFGGSSLLIVSFLGYNPGNFMTYLFQLMSPFLLIATFSMRSLQRPAAALAVPLILYCCYRSYMNLPRDFSYDAGAWQRVDQLIASHEHMLASPILIMSLLDNGKPVYQDGHTFYFPMARSKPAFLEPANPERRVAAIWSRYMRDLYAKIDAREFDLLLLTSWDVMGIFDPNPPEDAGIGGIEYLRQRYEVRETITVSMTVRPGGGPHAMQIWVPKPR